MNVEEVYNLEQKVAVSYPTVTAVGFAVTPRGSPRGEGSAGEEEDRHSWIQT